MTQINLLSIYEFGKKHLGWIVAISLFLIMFNCNGNSEHSQIIKERDFQNKELSKKVENLLKLNLEQDKLVKKADEAILKSIKKINSLKAEIAKEKTKGEKLIAKQKDYDLKDWKKFYQEKTKSGDKEILITNNTLNFTKAPLITIGNELVKGDVAKAELKITIEQLANTQDIVVSRRIRAYIFRAVIVYIAIISH